MKKYISGLINGTIITSFLGVIAVWYSAKEISFKPKDTNWKVKNVEGAVNDLKSNNKTSGSIKQLDINHMTKNEEDFLKLSGTSFWNQYGTDNTGWTYYRMFENVLLSNNASWCSKDITNP